MKVTTTHSRGGQWLQPWRGFLHLWHESIACPSSIAAKTTKATAEAGRRGHELPLNDSLVYCCCESAMLHDRTNVGTTSVPFGPGSSEEEEEDHFWYLVHLGTGRIHRFPTSYSPWIPWCHRELKYAYQPTLVLLLLILVLAFYTCALAQWSI